MGIAFQIPMGYYGWIAPRSGLALHHHIHVGAGVVDPDYTGPVQVLLLNFSSQNHAIEVNHHIAQLILEENCLPNPLWSTTNISDKVWWPMDLVQQGNKWIKEGRNLISPSHPKGHDNGTI